MLRRSDRSVYCHLLCARDKSGAMPEAREPLSLNLCFKRKFLQTRSSCICTVLSYLNDEIKCNVNILLYPFFQRFIYYLQCNYEISLAK